MAIKQRGKRLIRGRRAALAALGALLLSSSVVLAEDAPAYFKKYCVACHTIGGGRLIGPDLKGVGDRAERDWLVNFISDPDAILNSSDAYAKQILAEAKGVRMVPSPGINPDLAGALLDYIGEQSGQAGAAAVVQPLRPLTDTDAQHGQSIFSGAVTLRGGGPACISCHTIAGIGGLGGGRLGPDLAGVSARLGGANGLRNWLGAPPTAQMQATFGAHPIAEDEVIGLVAYLETAGATGPSPKTTGLFAGLGLVGALFNLLLFGGIWKRRLRGVRAPMVQAAKKSTLKLELPGGRNG